MKKYLVLLLANIAVLSTLVNATETETEENTPPKAKKINNELYVGADLSYNHISFKFDEPSGTKILNNIKATNSSSGGQVNFGYNAFKTKESPTSNTFFWKFEAAYNFGSIKANDTFRDGTIAVFYEIKYTPTWQGSISIGTLSPSEKHAFSAGLGVQKIDWDYYASDGVDEIEKKDYSIELLIKVNYDYYISKSFVLDFGFDLSFPNVSDVFTGVYFQDISGLGKKTYITAFDSTLYGFKIGAKYVF